MAKIDQELEQTLVEGTAGGGVVKIVMTAKEEVKEVKIDPEVVNKEEVDVLEDLISAALRDALTKAKEKAAEKWEVSLMDFLFLLDFSKICMKKAYLNSSLMS